MEFTRCPYDAAVIEVEANPTGSTRLSCSTCGAAWDWTKTLLQRVQEPDKAAVRAARVASKPSEVIRSAPNHALADAMWRQVRSLTSQGATGPQSSPGT